MVGVGGSQKRLPRAINGLLVEVTMFQALIGYANNIRESLNKGRSPGGYRTATLGTAGPSQPILNQVPK
jgi:hypothetical protein